MGKICFYYKNLFAQLLILAAGYLHSYPEPARYQRPQEGNDAESPVDGDDTFITLYATHYVGSNSVYVELARVIVAVIEYVRLDKSRTDVMQVYVADAAYGAKLRETLHVVSLVALGG